ncbi:GABA-specific permease [Kluyveromyces marxianus]|nr:GABA-specific permease [Kluyveromyces marxianus]
MSDTNSTSTGSEKNRYVVTSDEIQKAAPITSLRTITSRNVGEVNYINAKTAHDDTELLAEIGYKQELQRHFSKIQVFGVSFSIMGLLPSIASILVTALPGGMVSLVWGWFIAGFFVLTNGLAMSELASAIPTSGGLYYYTYHYAPPKAKRLLSFVVGNSNSLALIAGLCSVNYGLAGEILSIVVIAKDGNFEITNAKTYGVYAGCTIAVGIVTSLATVAVSRLQTFSIVSNLILIAIFFVALPIGVAKSDHMDFNSASYIFGNWENLSDWTDGWQFMLTGFTPVIWVIGAFDSCIHMSEEAKNATASVPFGIIGSITVCWILGFLICIVLAACSSKDIAGILGGKFGQPFAQIIFDAMGKNWAIALMVLIAFCQFLMASSILTAISRQIWAFARDDGLPFSRIIKVVNVKLSSPIRATWFGAICALAIGCLCLIGTQASSALFSLYISANYFSWMVPNLLRMTFGQEIFTPGAFYMGKIWSPIINWTSIAFELFIIILMQFPSMQHHITPKTMNYTVVFTGTVWIGSVLYFKFYKKKIFVGPKSNLTDAEYEENVGQDVLDAILSKQQE